MERGGGRRIRKIKIREKGKRKRKRGESWIKVLDFRADKIIRNY
jgi:hypothetical protein